MRLPFFLLTRLNLAVPSLKTKNVPTRHWIPSLPRFRRSSTSSSSSSAAFQSSALNPDVISSIMSLPKPAPPFTYLSNQTTMNEFSSLDLSYLNDILLQSQKETQEAYDASSKIKSFMVQLKSQVERNAPLQLRQQTQHALEDLLHQSL